MITKKWAKKVVRVPDVDTQVKGTTDIEEMDGKLTKQEENKLMNIEMSRAEINTSGKF